MSVNYSPVLWNDQKKYYDKIMLLFMVLYLVVFITLQLVFFGDITLETLIIRATGTLALLMLHFILIIGPLARIDQRFLPLLYNRRHFGVSMCLVALVHGLFSTIQFHGFSDVDPIVSLFTSNTGYFSLQDFPFQILGFFALIILLLMASTSHDFWLKNLSPKIWKSLHMMVYFAYALLVGHVLLGVVQLEKSPLLIGTMGLGVLIVSGFHTFGAILNWRQNNIPDEFDSDGFFRVCKIDEIVDNRAKTILIKKENIAIFKYDGKLSAVSNLCKHQNGPLGEGKIVDGCITCPWHGYQYLPHNGQSPPPFTEKVETYDVKLKKNWIYVHPKPYPPGTERPPCMILNPKFVKN